MNAHFLMISVLATTPAFAANFGTTSTTEPPKTTTVKPPTSLSPVFAGPQVTGMFRIVKPDGATVIQQSAISVGGSSINVINVDASSAFLASNGKCVFNVKYDEVSATAATNTTNRLFSNDTLIAQNTKIDLVASALKTIWTQPYLVPGQNNIKLVINAESSTPSVGWVRVNVTGTCGGATAGTTTPTKATTLEVKPPVTPPASPVVRFVPGSAEWNNLNIAFGYSNFGVAQLQGKPFERYTELLKLNADITVVVNAKVLEQSTYNSLMVRWNSFVNDSAFKAAMVAATAAKTSTDKK
ncbi:hypothetical protein [Aquabacterium sp.]|uniref:hypothetical protein n=1 Tax=Aquabacterium sp. TaxID=1872578 RepID=UPI0019B073A1|nr:hypothetical protein [Aquabacterium sp.]MBC7699926.1 hypothetical protein [Aquabacterium sp.]